MVITNESAENKTRVGYVRVSTVEQNEARQFEAFKDLELFKVYIEKASAKDAKRPVLNQMLEYVREGDTVYIKDFSRLARSTKDLLDILEMLNNGKIKLVSLKENLDTETPTGKLMLTMLAAIYEFERENILERQREGIAIARREGKYKGRKPVRKPDDWNEVYERYMRREITAKKAMELLGLKRNTFYRFVREAGGFHEPPSTRITCPVI